MTSLRFCGKTLAGVFGVFVFACVMATAFPASAATEADYLAAKATADAAKTSALAEQYDADVVRGDCEWHAYGNTGWYQHYKLAHEWCDPQDIYRLTYESHEAYGEADRGNGNSSLSNGDSDYSSALGAYSQGEMAAGYGCWDAAVQYMNQAATKFGQAEVHYVAAHAYYDLSHYSLGQAFGDLFSPGFTKQECCEPYEYQ